MIELKIPLKTARQRERGEKSIRRTERGVEGYYTRSHSHGNDVIAAIGHHATQGIFIQEQVLPLLFC
jgi:hypothetical protein